LIATIGAVVTLAFWIATAKCPVPHESDRSWLPPYPVLRLGNGCTGITWAQRPDTEDDGYIDLPPSVNWGWFTKDAGSSVEISLQSLFTLLAVTAAITCTLEFVSYQRTRQADGRVALAPERTTTLL
jgi:hypothetical protein